MSAIIVGFRRRRADPHFWTPPQSPAAVQRALRDGYTDDPRIHALARSAAARAVRHRWMLGLLPLGVLMFGAGVVTDLRDPDTTWWDLGVSVVWTVIPGLVFVHQLIRLRRGRKYLARHT